MKGGGAMNGLMSKKSGKLTLSSSFFKLLKDPKSDDFEVCWKRLRCSTITLGRDEMR
jgi:hypothetical protein